MIVVVEGGVELASSGDRCGIAAPRVLSVPGRVRSRRRGKNCDPRLAHCVARLELISLPQLEIELVGGDFHGLAAGYRIRCRSRLCWCGSARRAGLGTCGSRRLWLLGLLG